MNEGKAEVLEVEAIVNSRTLKGFVQYRMRWAGCTELEERWEIIDHLHKSADKL